MKKVRYTGDSVSGILLNTAGGYTEDLQFNPGIIRNVADEDAEKLGVRYPDIFEVYEPVKKRAKIEGVKKVVKSKPVGKKTGE